jgi:hypothetical protein
MAVKSLVSVDEYLHTSYDPDCDYVDGEIEERNLGESDQAWLQTRITIYFGSRERQYGMYVIVEQRVQVAPTRFRVPDVCLVVGKQPVEPILTKPPFLAVESWQSRFFPRRTDSQETRKRSPTTSISAFPTSG